MKLNTKYQLEFQNIKVQNMLRSKYVVAEVRLKDAVSSGCFPRRKPNTTTKNAGKVIEQTDGSRPIVRQEDLNSSRLRLRGVLIQARYLESTAGALGVDMSSCWTPGPRDISVTSTHTDHSTTPRASPSWTTDGEG